MSPSTTCSGRMRGMSDAARTVVRRLVITALLVVAGGLLWYSASIKGEPEAPSLSDSAVEQLVPARDTPTAIRQAEIGIDLVPGWDADLRINGVDVPEDEERDNGPLNQVFFKPGEGKVIEALAPGEVTVTAFIWRPTQGETRDQGGRTVSWTFRVA
jgi:hypothetical protein